MDEAAVRDVIDRVTATIGGRRRLIAAGLAALAVVAAVHAARPAPPPTERIWTAARDLAGALPLAADDLATAEIPTALVPAGAIPVTQRITGRLLAAPVRRGEPFTDVRLLGPSLLSALPDPDLVAASVRVADGAAATALVHVGDRVDVLATRDPGEAGPAPGAVVSGARVLAVPALDSASGDPAGLVIVAVTRPQATALARAASVSRLTVTLDRQ